VKLVRKKISYFNMGGGARKRSVQQVKNWASNTQLPPGWGGVANQRARSPERGVAEEEVVVVPPQHPKRAKEDNKKGIE